MLMLRVGGFAGIILLAAVSFSAQAGENQGATAGKGLRLSASADVDASCGRAVDQSLLQQQLEAGLLSHGIALSSVHTARLGMDVECMSSPESGATAIHQCLDLKELVSQTSTQGRAAMASTWRKCASFQCRGGACAKTADGRLASLVDAFSEELKARGVSVAAPVVTIRNAVAAPAAALTQAAAPSGSGTRTVFFSIYILFCLSVLLKWQLRGQYR